MDAKRWGRKYAPRIETKIVQRHVNVLVEPELHKKQTGHVVRVESIETSVLGAGHAATTCPPGTLFDGPLDLFPIDEPEPAPQFRTTNP